VNQIGKKAGEARGDHRRLEREKGGEGKQPPPRGREEERKSGADKCLLSTELAKEGTSKEVVRLHRKMSFTNRKGRGRKKKNSTRAPPQTVQRGISETTSPPIEETSTVRRGKGGDRNMLPKSYAHPPNTHLEVGEDIWAEKGKEKSGGKKARGPFTARRKGQ